MSRPPNIPPREKEKRVDSTTPPTTPRKPFTIPTVCGECGAVLHWRVSNDGVYNRALLHGPHTAAQIESGTADQWNAHDCGLGTGRG